MAITKTESNLIRLLVSLDMEKELILAVTDSLHDDDKRQQMIEFLMQRHEEKGQVTEQDVLKATIILTREKKETPKE